MCRFTQSPISPPALPFTHWALYHSHTWKSVTSSPNTTSLLFPLALWRQQGSPLFALIYNAVKLIQTCVFMRALISIVCACVYSREENCQSKMKPWLHFNPETPASSERHRGSEIQSVSVSRNAAQRQTQPALLEIEKSFPTFDESFFLRCHGCVKMGHNNGPSPESRTRRRDMSSICSSGVHDPRV